MMVNMYNKKQSTFRKRGFTLVEIMVSVAIFTIIITTGIGALVSMVNTYEVTQEQKKVHDGLNYALESMTREIRLGQNYFSEPQLNGSDQGSVNDGTGSSIGFNAADNRGYVMYYLDNGTLTATRIGATNAANGTQALTDDSQVIIETIDFRVIGTTPLSDGNYQQPVVWIRITARAQGSDRDTAIQTLISQRTLDA